jgi:hypothetical protein
LFLPERCSHLWTLDGVVASWNCIAAIPCISHFTELCKKWVIGSLQQIEVKVGFHVLAVSCNKLCIPPWSWVFMGLTAMLKPFSVLCFRN